MTKHGMTALGRFLKYRASLHDSGFGRLFAPNPIRLPADLNAARELLANLAASMRSDEDVAGDVPAGLTFFGQFIDHDITLDVTSELGRVADVAWVRNVRTPSLDLDCVYGAGREGSPHLFSSAHGGYLRFGTACDFEGARRNPLDLPRTSDGVALIGDPRNDENAIVSQIQGLFIRFHNIVLAKVSDRDSPEYKAHAHISEDPYQIAVTLVRWHYQWLVMNELLPAFVDPEICGRVLSELRHHRFPKPFSAHSPIIPLEFSVAAYRFGHATVQNRYQLNDQRTVDLFRQDGGPGLPAFGPKDPDDNLDLARFFAVPGSGIEPQTARPIGTKLPSEVFALPFVGAAPIEEEGGLVIPAEEAVSLAHRNIYRDRFTFQLASGQQAAAAMHLTPLDRNAATRDAGLDKIPLWYYGLQEAEEAYGGKLGQVAGTIVATVLLRLLKEDPKSVWHVPHWKPVFGADHGTWSLGHLVRFVTESQGAVGFWEELRHPQPCA